MPSSTLTYTHIQDSTLLFKEYRISSLAQYGILTLLMLRSFEKVFRRTGATTAYTALFARGISIHLFILHSHKSLKQQTLGL